jgi:hypothetical protein
MRGDDELRRGLAGLASDVDESGAWDKVQRRAGRMRRRRRGMQAASALLVLLLAVGGVLALREVLRPEPRLVIVGAEDTDVGATAPTVHASGSLEKIAPETWTTAAESKALEMGYALTDAEAITVTHPYHSEAADAPNYVIPESVSVAPGIALAEPPSLVPAQRLVLDELPDTDLALQPSPADPTELHWRLGEEEPFRTELSNEQVATQRAREFLHEHGLWLEAWGEPTVSVGSSTDGPDGYQVTSWIVRYTGESPVPGVVRSVSLRVGDRDRIVDLSLGLPKAEPLPRKAVRLRSLTEVLQDLQVWREGVADNGLQERAAGAPVRVVVQGYDLVYEKPLALEDEYLAVPVYEFRVEVRREGIAVAKGIWRVVAAADVERAATRSGG